MAFMNLPNVEFLLIAGRAVFLIFSFIVAAVTFTAWRRSASRQTDLAICQSQAVLERLTDLGQRLDASERCLAQLRERFEQPPERAAPAPVSSPGYQIAIRLARSGASSEELISGCGLTRPEAELVRRLHGPARPELRQAS